ncbi:NUDIX domain-containing protein (plasmid) [Pantoea sp. SGAir0430]
MMSPQVGIGVLIFRDGKLLLGQRKGSHGAGDWSAPGGHLEFGESPEACARREVLEETGLQLHSVHNGAFVSDVFPAVNRHYITLLMVAPDASGEPQLREPDKCAGWHWFAPEALPEPLFAPLQSWLARDGLAALQALAQRKDR